jgi:hypothetical protein
MQGNAMQGNAMQGKLAVLRDGSEILVRQIQDADSALLADIFCSIEHRVRQSRFHGKDCLVAIRQSCAT